MELAYAAPPAWSLAVDQFCRDHGIADAMTQCMDLARRHFAGAVPDAELRTDPRTGEQWVVVRVAAALSVEQASDAYDGFVRAWTAASDWNARKFIRLSYTVV